MPYFANPLGLLALLGIPAVLAIHFLQRKARELPVSTLFLLDHTRREAAGGRRFEKIIPSIPLWMQLLAVCLLAWYLAEPRYTRQGSVRRVAVVMDSSASMAVFKDQAAGRLAEALPALKAGAERIELTVLESSSNKARLYTGSSIGELKQVLATWQPRDGQTDPTPALRLARSLVSRDGVVVHVTDTPTEALPFDARQLAVGEAIDNVGFTGLDFTAEEGTPVWRALVRNHGKEKARRTWRMVTAAGATEERPIEIEPGTLMTLQAAFPGDSENVRIVLSADRFPLDDVLPLVVPKPKAITLVAATSAAFKELTEKLFDTIDAAEAAVDGSTADLTIVSYNPLDPVAASGNSIVFVEDETRTGAWLKGGIVAETHPLIDGLNWQSLLVRETIQLEQRPEDTILLWQEKRPLILLRSTGNQKQLLFNFDPTLSNIEKQPAFVVLLHRFAETIRAAKVAPYAANLETGQPLRITTAPDKPLRLLASDTNGKPLAESAPETARQAPTSPGFLRAVQGDTTLLNAAVHFADPRESDFSACASESLQEAEYASGIEQHTAPDPLWRVWILLLLAALIVSWKFTTKAEPA
jgi:Aerotolerance regulator N-terminal